MLALTLILVIVSYSAGATLPLVADDWADSPEAAFLTPEERAGWKTLVTIESRERFKSEYWRRRDPTPETAKNEFQELIAVRIRTADAQFAIGKTPGSRTARGMVFVVLGQPSTMRETLGPLKTAPELIAPGKIGIPHEAFETTEWHTWVYDRERTPQVLDALRRPSLEIAFIVEHGRRDQLQQPDIFKRWREVIARRSIVNP